MLLFFILFGCEPWKIGAVLLGRHGRRSHETGQVYQSAAVVNTKQYTGQYWSHTKDIGLYAYYIELPPEEGNQTRQIRPNCRCQRSKLKCPATDRQYVEKGSCKRGWLLLASKRKRSVNEKVVKDANANIVKNKAETDGERVSRSLSYFYFVYDFIAYLLFVENEIHWNDLLLYSQWKQPPSPLTFYSTSASRFFHWKESL